VQAPGSPSRCGCGASARVRLAHPVSQYGPFWSNTAMKTSTSPSPPSYLGHVKNGVIVLEGNMRLNEGQAVRIEPLSQNAKADLDEEPAQRVRQLQQLFAEWTEEDGKLSAEQADCLHEALEQNRGVSLRSFAKCDAD
jgi:hypothetical protein